MALSLNCLSDEFMNCIKQGATTYVSELNRTIKADL